MTRLRLTCLFLLVAAVGCDGADPIDVVGRADRSLYVANQGNFSDNNGSVTRYDLDTEEVTPDAVPNLGGLVQNLYSAPGELYVLLNFDDSFTTGNGRVDVVDVESGARTRQLDVRTPRAFGVRSATSVGPAEVYVSNLYDATVTPLNLITGATGEPVAVGAFPEGVVSVSGRTYVANAGFGSGTTLSVFDTDYAAATGDAVGTIDGLCQGPRTLLADRELEVWVVCTGTRDFESGEVTGGAVVVLDGATGAVRQRFDSDGLLGSATNGTDAVVVGDEVFVIGDGAVLRFDARANALAATLPVAGAPIGAIAYDAAAERIYLGRPDAASPYTVDGVVTIHDRAGAQVGQFGAGLAPSAFAFASTAPIREG